MSNDSLKILIALQYYVPHRTGLTLHVQRVAEVLARRGHQVTVLTARYDEALPADEIVAGVRVIRLWAPIRVSRGMVMPAYPLAAARLVQSHDVVSIHTPMLETALFGALTRWFGKGLVITHHGDLILPKSLANRFIAWFTFQMFKVAGHTAHQIIAYSDDYANNSYYIAPFRSKTAAVYPPIFAVAPDRKAAELLRRKWLAGRDAQAKVIGYAGRFVEEKRPDVLIESLPIIQSEYPGSKIVFAGEYDMSYEDFFNRHAALVEKYRDSLVFLGLLRDEQAVSNFYAACDVLALPSDTECFGLVQVEAMLCGTPVVATNIPGAREVVRRTGMGELVNSGNSREMGAGILRVLDNRAAYVKPRDHITSAFSLDETVDHYEHYLRKAADAASRSVMSEAHP